MIGLTMRSVTWSRFPIRNLWLIPCFFHLWSEVTWLLIPVERSQLRWVGHAITGPRNSDGLLPPPARMVQKLTKFHVAWLYFISAMFWTHCGVDPGEIRKIAENRDVIQILFCCCHCVPCENNMYMNAWITSLNIVMTAITSEELQQIEAGWACYLLSSHTIKETVLSSNYFKIIIRVKSEQHNDSENDLK